MTIERVVIDTNVLISSLFSTTSSPALALDKAVRNARDPKDAKFLEAAVNGRASTIVTGDRDLLALSPFRGVVVITPAKYLEHETL